MKRVLLLLTLLSLVVVALPALAQDAPIAYGEVVTGDLTLAAPEVRYSFEGAEGDVVVIKLDVPLESDLSSIKLVVLDSTGAELGNASSFLYVTFAAQLPAAGTYTIVATYDDPSTATSEGQFELSLISAAVLAVGEEVTGEVTSETEAYYAFQSEAAFTVTYAKTGGDFDPEVSVNALGDFLNPNNLNTVASIYGDLVEGGTLNVVPDGSTGSLFVIAVKAAPFDFNFDILTAQYALSISQ